jgi:hypothetical protein
METSLEKKARILNSLLIAFLAGVFMTLFFLYFFSLFKAVFLGFIGFLISGLWVYFFQNNKILEKQTLPEDIDSSSIVYSGGANHFLNREGVGGRLYLLKDSLFFKSHKLNLQNHELMVQLQDIAGVEFFNLAGFVPNGLLIRLKSGKNENFVVNNRMVWKTQIEKEILPKIEA